MNVEMKTWKEISLRQFNSIQEVVKTPDDWTTLNLLDIVYGVDSGSMTVMDLRKYAHALDFLKEKVPEVKLKKHYTLNGTEYDSHFDLTTVTMAQFIDYQNYCKRTPIKYEDVLSVFLTPKGHEYNDGYDVAKLKEDVMSLDICTVQSLAFFFGRQLVTYLEVFRCSSIEEVRRMKTLSKEERKRLEKQYLRWDLRSLAQSITSSQSARRQMRPSQA